LFEQNLYLILLQNFLYKSQFFLESKKIKFVTKIYEKLCTLT